MIIEAKHDQTCGQTIQVQESLYSYIYNNIG